MSRVVLNGSDEGTSLVVGYDPPMQEFFWQLYKDKDLIKDSGDLTFPSRSSICEVIDKYAESSLMSDSLKSCIALDMDPAHYFNSGDFLDFTEVHKPN